MLRSKGQPLADLLGLREGARVTREPHPVLGADDGPARPQRAVAVGHPASAEVAGGRADYARLTELERVPPLHLDDVFIGHAPGLEVGPDAEGDQEGDVPVNERRDGAHVEVVVVVMADHHGVQLRQLIERHRGLVEARRPHPLEGRRTLREHGVGQDAHAAELEEDGTVPQPRHGEGLREVVRDRPLHRNRDIGILPPRR